MVLKELKLEIVNQRDLADLHTTLWEGCVCYLEWGRGNGFGLIALQWSLPITDTVASHKTDRHSTCYHSAG